MSNESHESSSPLASRSGRGAGGEGPETKRCPKCGETKFIDAFAKDQSRKDGYQSHCKACQSAYYAANIDERRAQMRAYNAANADKRRKYNREWAANNVDKRREQRRASTTAKREYDHAHYAANADKRREQSRTYNANNADKLRDYRRTWTAANADKLRAQMRAWAAAHPDKRLASAENRRALKKGNGGDGFTASQLKHMRLTQGGECAYCMGLYHPRALTIDHVIPIDQGGPHEAANIVLACGICNSSKGNRTPDQWVNRWYYHKNG